jgi:hypothetical protein
MSPGLRLIADDWDRGRVRSQTDVIVDDGADSSDSIYPFED